MVTSLTIKLKTTVFSGKDSEKSLWKNCEKVSFIIRMSFDLGHFWQWKGSETFHVPVDYIIDKYTLKFVHLAFEISHFSSSSKWSPRHPHLNKILGKTLANLSQLRHFCYIHHFLRNHHFSRGLFVI